MEETIEPSADFLKGFNHGYEISRHTPEMKETVLSAENLPEDYRMGFEGGELQYEKDRIREEFEQVEQENDLDESEDMGMEY
ncbi:hypothetical protein CLV90_2778 [Maribacter spongiicola]|uniref:Uncharacterized protein n=1 Tax=Maribacter spongiicola TaxID=1206753 RepID=A0A4R7JZT4_9FLAO|nr:hypothetical protein [Maribacter spongiicola]TDT43656.1 hypothetical protein CLV90_2778 [Maribacter spongiicola]